MCPRPSKDTFYLLKNIYKIEFASDTAILDDVCDSTKIKERNYQIKMKYWGINSSLLGGIKHRDLMGRRTDIFLSVKAGFRQMTYLLSCCGRQ